MGGWRGQWEEGGPSVMQNHRKCTNILQIKICHPSKNSITHTHKNDTPTETSRQKNNNKGRKHKQQGPQQKPQTYSQGQQAKDKVSKYQLFYIEDTIIELIDISVYSRL